MSILLSSDIIFHLSETILMEWERCNILDGSSDVPTKLPKPIGKSTFGCLANLKENQPKKLARGLISWTLFIRERPTCGGRLDLKSMYDVCRTFKRKVIILNEIMIHFGFPKPTKKIRGQTRMNNDML